MVKSEHYTHTEDRGQSLFVLFQTIHELNMDIFIFMFVECEGRTFIRFRNLYENLHVIFLHLIHLSIDFLIYGHFI